MPVFNTKIFPEGSTAHTGRNTQVCERAIYWQWHEFICSAKINRSVGLGQAAVAYLVESYSGHDDHSQEDVLDRSGEV